MNKLMILCGSLGKGGAERVSLYLAEYMLHRKVETIIVTKSRVEDEYECPKEIKRYVLDETKEKIRINRRGISLIYYQISKLRKILLHGKFDTILIMDIPHCIYAIPACLGINIKVIASERNAPAYFSGKTTTKYLSRFLMRMADGFVFQTVDAKRYYGSFVRGKSIVIPNPISIERMPEIPYKGRRDKKIVSVARLHKQKNQMMLIGAFASVIKEYPDYQLYIWGEGAEREKLENYIKKLGIEKSVFLPGMTENIFIEIYKASMFVLSSDFEGMPNALIEAMALGLPCVSTDCPCGGPRELIENKKNGVLVPVNDKDAMAKGIQSILKDEKYAELIGNEAFKIRERLQYKKVCNEWYEFIK